VTKIKGVLSLSTPMDFYFSNITLYASTCFLQVHIQLLLASYFWKKIQWLWGMSLKLNCFIWYAMLGKITF